MHIQVIFILNLAPGTHINISSRVNDTFHNKNVKAEWTITKQTSVSFSFGGSCPFPSSLITMQPKCIRYFIHMFSSTWNSLMLSHHSVFWWLAIYPCLSVRIFAKSAISSQVGIDFSVFCFFHFYSFSELKFEMLTFILNILKISKNFLFYFSSQVQIRIWSNKSYIDL